MLSIIVISYNTRELLRRCLQSLQKHNPDAEIIVVDNASHDRSVEMTRAEFPTVKLIQMEENIGFARANNIGLPYANGEFVLLLNSDTYLVDDTLNRCMEWMCSQPEVAAASPRLIGFDGVPQAAAHPFPSFHNKLRQTFWMPSRRVDENLHDGNSWLIGAALMLRKEALKQLDGFLDTEYFMYWEDTDLCSRLILAGWKLGIYKDGHVRHLGGASSNGEKGGQRPELYACFQRGKYRWFGRYRPRWEIVGIWGLDAIDVVRKYLRGIFYGRWQECVQSSTLAKVLARPMGSSR